MFTLHSSGRQTTAAKSFQYINQYGEIRKEGSVAGFRFNFLCLFYIWDYHLYFALYFKKIYWLVYSPVSLPSGYV